MRHHRQTRERTRRSRKDLRVKAAIAGLNCVDRQPKRLSPYRLNRRVHRYEAYRRLHHPVQQQHRLKPKVAAIVVRVRRNRHVTRMINGPKRRRSDRQPVRFPKMGLSIRAERRQPDDCMRGGHGCEQNRSQRRGELSEIWPHEPSDYTCPPQRHNMTHFDMKPTFIRQLGSLIAKRRVCGLCRIERFCGPAPVVKSHAKTPRFTSNLGGLPT